MLSVIQNVGMSFVIGKNLLRQSKLNWYKSFLPNIKDTAPNKNTLENMLNEQSGCNFSYNPDLLALYLMFNTA